MRFKLHGALALLAAAAFTACGHLDPIASEDLARGASSASTISGSGTILPPAAHDIQAAIDHPSRRRAVRDQDERRQAQYVLAFFGIEPGMTVLDMYSGGGYYTELLSYLVGADGRVVAHNNTPYSTFAKAEIAERYQDDRLTNVEQLIAENNELKLSPDAFDAVLLILAYHDVYFVDEDIGWSEINRPELLVQIKASMKPGAVLGVVDHIAAPGSPAETGGTLHRIDPQLIRRDITNAGFVFDGESFVLRNAADDPTKDVFAEEVRGQTDRAVLRFRKP